MITLDRNKKFVVAASGVFFCYLCFGIVQEDITRSHYKLPDDSYEMFVFPTALVCFYCCVNFLFIKLLSVSFIKLPEDTTKTAYYFVNALSYLLSMICGNMSLQFINYPTHVIGKAVKPLFVMGISVLLGRKNFTLKKYFCVTTIIIGAIIFMYKDKGDSAKKGFSLGLGELLVFLSLVMDGITAGVQERMLAEHQTKSTTLMLNMNKWATIFAGVIIFLTGELFKFVEFVHRHPLVLGKAFLLSIASCFGQLFIFMMVTEFGPLPCAVFATLRKLFSVLISVVLLGNPLLPRQWIGTFIVFVGLFLDIYYGKSSSKAK